MSDALTNAMQAFSIVDNAFARQRAEERQSRLDTENTARNRAADARAEESHAQDTKIKQHTIDQQQELDEANYFGTQIKRITDALEKSNMDPSPAPDQATADADNSEDPYNQLVDQVWSDKRFQDIVAKRPWAKDLLAKATARVQTYNDFGNQLADIVSKGDEYVAQGFLKGNGNHQELVGAPAQQLFDNLARQRELSGESFPKTVNRDSIKFVSPEDGHGWVLEFQYTNDKGQVVPGVATLNRTKAGEPGAENDPVIRKTIPELLGESRQKRDANMALALLQTRAAAGDKTALAEVAAIDREGRQQALSEKKRQLVIATMKGMAPDASVSDISRALVGNGVEAKEAKDIASALVKEPKESKLEWRGMAGKPLYEQAYKDGVAVPESEGGMRLRWQPHAPKENGSSAKADLQTQKDTFSNIKQRQADYDKRRATYNAELQQAISANDKSLFKDLAATAAVLEQDRLAIRNDMELYNKNYGQAFALQGEAPQQAPAPRVAGGGMRSAVVAPAQQVGKSGVYTTSQLPAGSKSAGMTKDGRPVYQLPNGKLVAGPRP